MTNLSNSINQSKWDQNFFVITVRSPLEICLDPLITLINVTYMGKILALDMPQTSELRLSSSMPSAVVSTGADDAKVCTKAGCIHTGTYLCNLSKFQINF